MFHPKMRYTYVGVDSHRDSHTAVFLDCFFTKLGEITFENMPSKFEAFLSDALKLQQDGTVLLFGLEDVSAYGRTLTVFLKKNNQQVKHVNALLVSRERKNQTITQKTDAIDAECAARVLLSKFDELPDAQPEDGYWVLRTLVMRRDFIVRNNISLKNHLHSLILQHYPGYRDFFHTIDSGISLAFFMHYPSPSVLEGTTREELAEVLLKPSKGQFGKNRALNRAQQILDSLQDTTVAFQELRDTAVQSTIRQIQFNQQEIEQLEATLADILDWFETPLTSMSGINTVSAAQILSCIGDIKRFPSPAKLARYAGIAPVTYSSGKKDMHFANQRGDRELNSLFYMLAVRLVATTGSTNRIRNHFFYEYYHRKISEGKTKRQALKCVQRRLINIIWSMLFNNTKYVNPPLTDMHENDEDT
jgi:transposase